MMRMPSSLLQTHAVDFGCLALLRPALPAVSPNFEEACGRAVLNPALLDFSNFGCFRTASGPDVARFGVQLPE